MSGISTSLESRIPPSALTVLLGVAMWFVDSGFSEYAFHIASYKTISAVLALVGVILCLYSKVLLRRSKTMVMPMRLSTTGVLVKTGLYRYTRNPMYFGYALLLAGWAFYLQNVLAFVLIVVDVFYLTRFQIKPEERELMESFGQEYAIYCSQVPRWL